MNWVRFLSIASILAASAVSIADDPRPFLGVYGGDSLNPAERGAIVQNIVPNSPADKAGLQEGDRVVAVNDRPIAAFPDLSAAVSAGKVGDEVNLKVQRNGNLIDVKVKLEARPDQFAGPPVVGFGPGGAQFPIPGALADDIDLNELFNMLQGNGGRFPMNPAQANRPRIGIQLQEIDIPLRTRLGLGDTKGVAVADVTPGSPAAKAGLAEYDVITEADGTKIESSRQLSEIISAKQPGDAVVLKVFRNGQTTEKTLNVEELPRGNLSRRFYQGNSPRQPGVLVPGPAAGGLMIPLERVAEMQNRIKELEQKVDELTKQLEQSRTGAPVQPSAPSTPVPPPSSKSSPSTPPAKTPPPAVAPKPLDQPLP